MSRTWTLQDWEGAARFFQVLSAPVRIGIVLLLVERPRSVGELVELLDAPQPLVSQHLRVLRQHCIVEGRREGRVTLYRVIDDHVVHIAVDAATHVAEHEHESRDGHPHHPAEQSAVPQ